jgi:hypothetical protein
MKEFGTHFTGGVGVDGAGFCCQDNEKQEK